MSLSITDFRKRALEIGQAGADLLFTQAYHGRPGFPRAFPIGNGGEDVNEIGHAWGWSLIDRSNGENRVAFWANYGASSLVLVSPDCGGPMSIWVPMGTAR